MSQRPKGIKSKTWDWICGEARRGDRASRLWMLRIWNLCPDCVAPVEFERAKRGPFPSDIRPVWLCQSCGGMFDDAQLSTYVNSNATDWNIPFQIKDGK